MSGPGQNPRGIEITELAGTDTADRPRSASNQRRLNSRMGWCLIALVALAPIPLGSNRPVFWAISALLLALAGMIYGLSIWAIGARYRFPLARIAPATALYLVFVAFLALQALPVFPSTFVSATGFRITVPTLSIAPGETILMLMRQLSYGLFFFLMLQVAVNPQRANAMLTAIFTIVTAHALFGMVSLTQLGDTVLFLEKTAYLGAATGTFINRNSFATFLAMGGVAGLSLFLSELSAGQGSRRRSKLLSEERLAMAGYLVAMALIGATLVATQSRMGTLSFLAGASAVGILHAVTGKAGLGRMFGLAIATGALALVIVGVLFGAGLFERLGSVETSFDVRFDLYRQVLGMIGQRPWTGFGGGSFEAAYPLFHQPPVSLDLIWDKTHSSYLALWVELGVIFGSLPLIALALLVIRAWPRKMPGEALSPASSAAIGASVVVAMHSLLDFSLEIQANVWLYLALLALGVAGTLARDSVRGRSRSGRG